MENMTIAQLKEVATQKRLTFKAKITKPELLALIEGIKVTPKVGNTFKGEY